MAAVASETSPPSVDPWAALGLPRRAALTPEEVRAAFQKTAAERHPDNAEDEAEKARRTAEFTALNEAAATLSSTPRRLRALLALEFPDEAAAPPPAMDDALLNLFAVAGQAVNAVSQLTAKRAQATTRLAKAALKAAEFRAQETLEAAGAAVNAGLEQLRQRLLEIDEAREKADPAAAEMLRAAAHRAAFLEKWRSQLQAAFAGLGGF